MDESVAFMNPRLAFVILGSVYFSVLLGSYLLVLFYPFFTLYGWLLIPVVVNFFLGYLVEEMETAVKIIVTYFSLQTIIVIGLLNVPSVYDAFSIKHIHSFWESPFLAWFIVTIFAYCILHIPLNIAVSCLGVFVRKNISDIIAVYEDFVRQLPESARITVKFLFVMSIFLLMGTVSTWVSSDFYRQGEPITRLGRTVNIISCGFPLPYLHFTNSSIITIYSIAEPLGIQPFNHTNFLLDTLFYTSIYSIITAFGYAITRSKKIKKKLDKYLRARS